MIQPLLTLGKLLISTQNFEDVQGVDTKEMVERNLEEARRVAQSSVDVSRGLFAQGKL